MSRTRFIRLLVGSTACAVALFAAACTKNAPPKNGMRPVLAPPDARPAVAPADARAVDATRDDPRRGRFVADIPGIDLAGLAADAKQTYVKILNDELCSCNHPHTAAICLADKENCGSAAKMGRFVVRKLKAGVGEKTIVRALQDIFGERPRRFDFTLVGVPRLGPSNAKVKLVEFSDFQCPMCRRVEPIVKSILADYPTSVAFYSRHFPLPHHEFAHVAAQAAEAAGAQGKYWKMQEALFQHQDHMSRAEIFKVGKLVGLDIDRLMRELDSKRYAAAVDLSRAEGLKAGVQGTPSFFVNGVLVKGHPTEENLRDWIEAALDN